MQTNTMEFTVLGKEISLFSAQWIYIPIENHTKGATNSTILFLSNPFNPLIPNIHTWWTLFFHLFKQSHIFYVSQNVFYWSIHKSFIENLFCQKIYSNDLNRCLCWIYNKRRICQYILKHHEGMTFYIWYT